MVLVVEGAIVKKTANLGSSLPLGLPRLSVI